MKKIQDPYKTVSLAWECFMWNAGKWVRSGNLTDAPSPSAPTVYLSLRHQLYATDYFKCSISLWIWNYHWAFTVSGLLGLSFWTSLKILLVLQTCPSQS